MIFTNDLGRIVKLMLKYPLHWRYIAHLVHPQRDTARTRENLETPFQLTQIMASEGCPRQLFALFKSSHISEQDRNGYY
jgi:hypothetical protein